MERAGADTYHQGTRLVLHGYLLVDVSRIVIAGHHAFYLHVFLYLHVAIAGDSRGIASLQVGDGNHVGLGDFIVAPWSVIRIQPRCRVVTAHARSHERGHHYHYNIS